jgi:hypothetical protein
MIFLLRKFFLHDFINDFSISVGKNLAYGGRNYPYQSLVATPYQGVVAMRPDIWKRLEYSS